MRQVAVLALESGKIFYGESIGATGCTVGELVFNTAMTGYQEILTDPSYSQQIVTLTYPHIGNTGINPEDEESKGVYVQGLVIRDLPRQVSNWRSEQDLESYLIQQSCVAIANVDTRAITRILRDEGCLNACIMTGDIDEEKAVQMARDFPGLKGMDLAKQVSTKDSYQWQEGLWDLENGHEILQGGQYHVVAYDFGVKRNILRNLAQRGCRITVVPAQTPASECLALKPDGIFLSNGPGDPEPCDYAIAAIQDILKENIPVFGICLGHQLLSLAAGAKTIKMKFGHHGANHPVLDLATKRVSISSQNHGFAVDEASLPANVKTTHKSLFDNSLQGIQLTDHPAFGFQGHPEASPGPHDIDYLFEHFIELMEGKNA